MVYQKVKHDKLPKYCKNEEKYWWGTMKNVRYKAFCKSLSHSKMHFNSNFISRGVKMDVCGLDHSGSQPFNCSYVIKYFYDFSHICL